MRKRMLAAMLVAVMTLTMVFLTMASPNEVGGYSYKNSNGEIDLAGYFEVEGAKISMKEESMDFVMTGKEATVTFKKPLAADGFSLSFAGIAKNSLKEVEVTIADIEDKKQSVEFAFSRMNDLFTGFVVNDAARSYIVDGSIYMKNSADFVVTYDEDVKGVGYGSNYMVPIMNTKNGGAFNGFSSQKVNLSIRLSGEKDSVFRLTQINRQRWGSLYCEDSVQPMICIKNPIDSAMKGTKITLPVAIAMDVLADNAAVTMNVIAPDGTPVKNTGGKELTNVSASDEHSITIEQYGSYTIEYQATDGTNATRTIATAIRVSDETVPELELKEPIPVLHKVGDKLEFPEIICSDNVTAEEAIVTWVTVTHPDGTMTQEISEVELTQEGVYEIGFQALDEAGNITFITVKTYAEGE